MSWKSWRAKWYKPWLWGRKGVPSDQLFPMFIELENIDERRRPKVMIDRHVIPLTSSQKVFAWSYFLPGDEALGAEPMVLTLRQGDADLPDLFPSGPLMMLGELEKDRHQLAQVGERLPADRPIIAADHFLDGFPPDQFGLMLRRAPAPDVARQAHWSPTLAKRAGKSPVMVVVVCPLKATGPTTPDDEKVWWIDPPGAGPSESPESH